MTIRLKLTLLFLLTVLVLTGLGWYAIVTYRSGMAEQLRLQAEVDEVVKTAETIRTTLQEQRAAWKNVLLRGSDPDAYYRHLNEFFDEEREARQGIDALARMVEDDPALVGPVARLRSEHLELGRGLRDAMRVFNANVDSPHQLADRVAGQLEEGPHRLIDLISNTAHTERQEAVQALEARLQHEERLLIGLLIVIGGGSMLAFFWALDRNVGKPAETAAYLANYDPLTALPNRVLFQDRLEHAIQRAKRAGETVTLVFFDLDHFKAVNDALGHQAGDQLLQEVGERLRRVLRDSDTPARLGGDEFAVIVENSISDAHAAHLAQTVVDALRQPIQLGRQRAHVSASIGITRYPQDGENGHQLLRNADAAMYLAKQKGRGRYHFFTEELNAAAERRLELENLMREAVQEQRFEIHFQPQVSLPDGQLTGVEALLRYRGPDGFIPPEQFVPVLEETGLINDVGKWVLRQACSLGAGWCDRFGMDLQVAVNLSARQLQDLTLPDIIREALEHSGLASHCLEVEITERDLLEARAAGEVLQQLERLGVRVAIDDFGTGYSSLSYLKSFDVDTLKIDRSFIRDITRDDDDDAVTSAIIALAKKLGISVIAEGVETEEQQAFLVHQGCDGAQGYLFARPMPPNELEKWHTVGVAGTAPLRS